MHVEVSGWQILSDIYSLLTPDFIGAESLPRFQIFPSNKHPAPNRSFFLDPSPFRFLVLSPRMSFGSKFNVIGLKKSSLSGSVSLRHFLKDHPQTLVLLLKRTHLCNTSTAHV